MHRIACPVCGQRLRYTAEQVGKSAKCQKCGQRFSLPAPLPDSDLPAADPEPAREAAPARRTPPPANRRRALLVGGAAAGLFVGMATLTAFFWPYPDENPYVEDRGGVDTRAVPLDPDGTAYRPQRFAQLALGWLVCGSVVGLVAVATKPRGPATGRRPWRALAGAGLLVALTAAAVFAATAYDPYRRDPGAVVVVRRLTLASPLESLNSRRASEWNDPSVRPFVLPACPDPTTDPRVMKIQRPEGDILVIPNALLDKNYTLPILRVLKQAGESPVEVEIKLVDRIPVGLAYGTMSRDPRAHAYYDIATRTDYRLVKKRVLHQEGTDGTGRMRTTTELLPDAVGADGKRYSLYFTDGVLEAVTGDGTTYLQPG